MPPELVVKVVGDTSELTKAYAKATKATKGFDRNLSQAGRGATAATVGFKGLGRTVGFASGAFLGGAGLAAGLKAAFGEMADSQRVAAQTAAVLKSTGGAANVSAEQVDALATALLNKTGIDDEQIKSAENLLLTFTRVRNEVGRGNDVFTRATKTAVDMSVALGEDAKSAALQLGKALNDPVKGVTALQRVGVQFTAAQRDQIKALVASGHQLEAQKLILAELNKEFGGSAEAAGKTLPGQLNKLRETLLNLGGAIAEKLAPTIQRLLERLNAWLSNSKNQARIMDTLKQIAGALTTGLNVLKKAFDALNAITGSTRHTLELLIGSFVAFKALKAASAVLGIARSFGVLDARMGGSAKSATALKGALGKAGLAGAAGLASFELTTLILKTTGLDKKLKSLGGSAFDAASALGLVHDPTKQFQGKVNLGQGPSAFLRRQAARLELGGLSESATVARILSTHANLATHDVQVLAHFGSRQALVGAARGTTINIGVVQTGATNAKELEADLTRRAKSRAHTRRGGYDS